jgi:hypothetical protein
MTDTTPDVAALVRERYRQMTPSARVEMACAMFETAKALATAGIRASQPDISEIDLKIAIFDRFYRRDVSEADRAAVTDRIRAGR